MLSDILLTINWIAFVAVVAAGPMTYSYFKAKTIPKQISAISGLVAFLMVFSALFLLYRSVGFPYWMRWPNQLLAAEAKPASFEKPGYYKLSLAGWQHNSTPEGDVFTCSSCDSQIQVQIAYGPELEAGSQFKNNEEFISLMSNPARQSEFANSILRSSLPSEAGIKFDIEKVGLTKIGGIDALQYMGTVEIPPTLTHETSMIAVHKGRIMKISLNFYDGAMNDDVAKKVNTLFSSLHFL